MTHSAEAQPPAPLEASHRGKHEVGTVLRASLSSVAATAADGLAYQGLLVVLAGSYGVAAFGGAVLGGVTNFMINWRWVFAPTDKRLRLLATQYALASLLTYVALQASLFAFIEGMHMDEHIAWVPAKLIAWVFVSYPIQRLLVFSSGRTTGAPGAETPPPASETPTIPA